MLLRRLPMLGQHPFRTKETYIYISLSLTRDTQFWEDGVFGTKEYILLSVPLGLGMYYTLLNVLLGNTLIERRRTKEIYIHLRYRFAQATCFRTRNEVYILERRRFRFMLFERNTHASFRAQKIYIHFRYRFALGTRFGTKNLVYIVERRRFRLTPVFERSTHHVLWIKIAKIIKFANILGPSLVM